MPSSLPISHGYIDEDGLLVDGEEGFFPSTKEQEQMMPSKNILKSKTAWFNFAMAVILGLGTSGLVPILNDPTVIGYVTAGGNALLRIFGTSQPVTVLPK